MAAQNIFKKPQTRIFFCYQPGLFFLCICLQCYIIPWMVFGCWAAVSIFSIHKFMLCQIWSLGRRNRFGYGMNFIWNIILGVVSCGRFVVLVVIVLLLQLINFLINFKMRIHSLTVSCLIVTHFDVGDLCKNLR